MSFKIGKYIYRISSKTLLGQGSQGDTYIGLNTETSETVAIKQLNLTKYQDQSKFEISLKKINLMLQLTNQKSENIVQMKDHIQIDENVYFITEWCNGGSLKQYLQTRLLKKKSSLSEEKVIILLADLLNGLLDMVTNGISLRELKPKNILIQKKIFKIGVRIYTNFSLKICKVILDPLSILAHKLQSISWSIGIILYECLYQKAPWEGNNQTELINNIANQPLLFSDQISNISQQLRELISKCLMFQEKFRISYHDLMMAEFNVKFFNKYSQIEKQLQKKEEQIIQHFIITHSTQQKIDLDSLFQRFGGYSQKLNFNELRLLLQEIDNNLELIEIDYIYNKIVKQDNDISQQQFLDWLNKYNQDQQLISKQEIQNDMFDIPDQIKSFLEKILNVENKNPIELFQAFEEKINGEPQGYIIIQKMQKVINPSYDYTDIIRGIFKSQEKYDQEIITLQSFLEGFLILDQNKRKNEKGLQKQVDKYIINISKDSIVGEGKFGVVYKARDQKTGQMYAIKVIPKSKVQASPKNMEGLTNEINILKQLRSPNIVQMVDVLETSNNFYIVQELCDGGDLAKLLRQKKKLTYQEVFNMIVDLLNGFAELLINGFIHRDLKPANILINQGKFKLADFGFARAVDNFNQQLFVSYVGTPLYMSPQILKGQKYTTKSDIWSFGFIIYEALYGKTPWTAQSIPELVRNIETKKLEFPDEIAFVSQDLKALIAKCLIANEEQRISWQDFMKDPLFIQHFDMFKQMDYDLENKEKFILQNIRNQVETAGVDIDTLFENIVRNNKRNLNLDEFSETLKQLEPTLTNFEIQYIFNKVDTKKQNFIDREEFRNWLITNGVRMSTFGSKQKFDQQVATKEVAMAVLRTLKMAVVQHNIDVKELFNRYELKINNKPLGYITMEGFTRMIRKIDPNAAELSILQAFRQFDHQNNSKIPFEQFSQTIVDINV